MRWIAIFIAAGALVACDDADGTGPENTNFAATLNGQNEIPAVVTTATGIATFDVRATSIVYRIEVENLVSALSAHIHIGGADVTGPIAATLFEDSAGLDIVAGVLAEGIIDAIDINPAVSLSFAMLEEALASGSAYVNVHTTAHPDGEIRGQIK